MKTMTLNLRVLLCILMLFAVSATRAQSSADQRMIERATPYFGTLNEVIDLIWPDLSMRTFVASQVEQESLWNPKAELCVPKPSCSRERGVGFGQFTVTPKMNVFEEVKRQHPLLRNWSWEDRFNPRLQLIAVVVKDKAHYRQCIPLMSNEWGGLACVASSYNGGFGGFSADRRLCSNTAGCNPQQWTDNIEHTSLKAKKALQGYGKSFFEINREYVDYVMNKRSPKYAKFVDRPVKAPIEPPKVVVTQPAAIVSPVPVAPPPLIETLQAPTPPTPAASECGFFRRVFGRACS